MANLTAEQFYIIKLMSPSIIIGFKNLLNLDWVKKNRFVKESKSYMAGFGIENSEQFIEYMKSWEESGNSRKRIFNEARYKYLSMSNKQRQDFLIKLDDEEKYHQYKVIHCYGDRINDEAATGYEYYCRLCCYIRALSLGYIDEELFWDETRRMAKICQSSFDSYEDYIFSIYLSSMFFDRISFSKYGKRFSVTIRGNTTRYDAIMDCPWDIDL